MEYTPLHRSRTFEHDDTVEHTSTHPDHASLDPRHYPDQYDTPDQAPSSDDFPVTPSVDRVTYAPPSQPQVRYALDSSSSQLSWATVRVAIKEVLETAIYILLVFVIVRSLVQNFKIEGNSMEPTLHSGQYILVNKLLFFHFDLNAPLRLLPGQEDLEARIFYPLRQPERGDIVVFKYPRDTRKDYIKRVIGLPGETVTIRDGNVYVNNVLLDEPYLQGAPTFCTSGTPCSMDPVVVAPDSIFVMGDNRSNSSDSREWDSLPLNQVVGQAWLLYYPVSDWGVIPHHSYASDEPPAYELPAFADP